ncbi:MAG TPA: hypothetical protein VGW78_02095 [Candidatus Babeliales bacterium]|nr:hypothetical protein [Candidatus Babeliales bacterium]
MIGSTWQLLGMDYADGLEIFCDHSPYLSYEYSNDSLKLLARLNKKCNEKVILARACIKKKLKKTIDNISKNHEDFNPNTLTFNKWYTACGWTYCYCKLCTLSKHKPCEDTESQCPSKNRCACRKSDIEMKLYCLEPSEAIRDKSKRYIMRNTLYVAKFPLPKHPDNLFFDKHNESYVDTNPWFNQNDELSMFPIYADSASDDLIEYSFYNGKVIKRTLTQPFSSAFTSSLTIKASNNNFGAFAAMPSSSLNLFKKFPVFFSALLHAKKHTYLDESYKYIKIDSILAEMFHLNENHLKILAHMIKYKSPNKYPNFNPKQSLIASYLAHIGDTNTDLKGTLFCAYINHYNKKFSFPNHDIFYLNPLGGLTSKGQWIRFNDFVSFSNMVMQSTIDAIETIDDEMQKSFEQLYIIQPKPDPTYTIDPRCFHPEYFIEIQKKIYNPCIINLWKIYGNTVPIQYDFKYSSQLTNMSYIYPWKNNLIIILNAMIYNLKKDEDKTITCEDVLITKEEENHGYTIKDIEPIDLTTNTITVHLNAVTWWEKILCPIKKISLLPMNIVFKRYINYPLLYPWNFIPFLYKTIKGKVGYFRYI